MTAPKENMAVHACGVQAGLRIDQDWEKVIM